MGLSEWEKAKEGRERERSRKKNVAKRPGQWGWHKTEEDVPVALRPSSVA